MNTLYIERDYEGKYLISPHHAELVLNLLYHACLPDRKYPENYIFTIYYDTRDLDSYNENINGDNLKSKLRARWYSSNGDKETFGGEVYFEIKAKEGAKVRKARKIVHIPPSSLENIWHIDSPMEDYIREVSMELGWEKIKKIYPIILIQYKRNRFLDNLTGTRISLDTQIHATHINDVLLPGSHPARLSTAVLEVKGKGNELPAIMNTQIKHSFHLSAFSKYTACLDSCMMNVA